MTAYTILEPLIRRKVFADEQIAVREITRDYVRLQVEMLIREIRGFERRYGMSFDRFDEYLHLRSSLLTSGQLGPEQKRTLGQALMREEDDWLDWKAAQEMLDNWLDLRQEDGVSTILEVARRVGQEITLPAAGWQGAEH